MKFPSCAVSLAHVVPEVALKSYLEVDGLQRLLYGTTRGDPCFRFTLVHPLYEPLVYPQINLVWVHAEMANHKRYHSMHITSIRTHLEATNPERAEKFVADSPAAVKRILADFKNFEVSVYSGISQHPVSRVESFNPQSTMQRFKICFGWCRLTWCVCPHPLVVLHRREHGHKWHGGNAKLPWRWPHTLHGFLQRWSDCREMCKYSGESSNAEQNVS